MSKLLDIKSNLPEIEKIFKDLGGTPKQLDRFAQASAFEAEGFAKSRVPVDNGFLGDSINVEPNRKLAEFGIWTIKANEFYAPYVEFGTGTKVKIPRGLEKLASEFKGEIDIVGQKAQPYLYPSAIDGQKKFKDLLLKWINKTVKQSI